jgi:hypothetical protein
MGELKSCLFCGKRVDQAFEYCPHCGYEFGDDGDSLSTTGPEPLLFGADRSAAEPPHELSPRSSGSELPVLVEEDNGACVPPADEDYLHRLRALQQTLADMERELDRLLAMEGELGRGGARLRRAEGEPRIASRDP